MVRLLSDDEVRALHYELLLKDILRAAEKLPPFPDVVWKVMGLIRKTAPVSEIEAVVKYDQAIVSRIITLSQSAFYGRRYEVGSLQEAILVLGGNRLMQVLMTSCVEQYLRSGKKRADPSERELWEHSVATAIMSELVSRRIKLNKVLTVYTAGLLHDIGKTVLDLYAKMYLGTSLKQIRGRSPEFIAAERRSLGIDHQELGEIIARRWKFPAEIIAAIGHHHVPQKATSGQDVAAVVYLANRMVAALEETDENASPFEPEQDPIFKKVGINAVMVETLGQELKEALTGVKQLLSREP